MYPCISVTKHIEIRYRIDGFEQYGFGQDKQLYNCQTGRRKRMVLNGSTKGYWIGRKFLSLHQLRPLLKRPENFEIPF
jgi:hypothetical protein